MSDFFPLRTNYFTAMMVRKLGANMSLLVWNEKVDCNKREVIGQMGKSFASVSKKAKTRLILFTFFAFSYRLLPD